MSSVHGRRDGNFAKMWSFGVIVLLWMAGPSRAAVTETEVRDFAIAVDGKSSGNYRMVISRHDDGKVSVSGDANVLIKKVFITVYRYTYNGTEWWQEGKDSRLLRLDSTSNEDGKQLEVHAVSGPNGLRVVANGQERAMSSDAWTTTYWRLAASRFINKAVPLLDADTGRAFNGRLEFVGTEQLNVGGQNQACRHFRVTGGPNNVDELWYDAQDRLVRQEFTERNARTVLTLVRVSR